jgi:acetolactate decarboxylase
MPESVAIPPELYRKLLESSQVTGETPDALAARLLGDAFSDSDSRRALYVSAPVNALVEGIYREDTRIADILARGDFGLGTFNDLDGEMMVLDGQVYQLRSDGWSYSVEAGTRTPFACVNFFRPDSEETIERPLDFAGLTDLLERLIPSPNLVYAIRIEGHFDYIRTRSVPRQACYRPLVEVTRQQPEYELEQVDGVMAGYWTPTFMQSLAVPGYHLHFITEDRTRGGHLLECRSRHMRIGLQHLPRIEVGLPITLDYLTAQFTRNLGSDLDEAEH